nr:hypothetical protein [Tanacetum cinerariifolium]
MLVLQQAQDVEDAAEDQDAVNEVSDESTPPSPTPATPPPPQQKHIPSPTPATIAQSSPLPQQPASYDDEISMTLLNTLLETCSTLTKQVANLEQDKIAQAIKIAKLKQRVKRGCWNNFKQRRSKCSKKKKGMIIQDPEEAATTSLSVQSKDEAFARDLEAELNANNNWNQVIEQVKRKERQDNTIMRYQALKRKLVTEAQARKNMMIYLKNMVGFKMDFFKSMTYTDIRSIFEKHFNYIWAFLKKGENGIKEEESKRKSENLEKKATKKQKIDEETEELKTHLQIIPNDEDDVYTEATPLALKRDQRGRYGLEKVKSWKLFESCEVHIITFTTTHMILLVERKYPLTRFTLEQMLNNVRLEVEKESEMSLELLRLMRTQQQEGYKPE